MHVLLLPPWYRTRSAPTAGLYFAEYAQALMAAGVQVGIAYPEARSLRELSLRAVLENHWQITTHSESGIPTARLHDWRLTPRVERPRARARSFVRLISSYLGLHGKPDLLHAHSGLAAGMAAMATGTRLGTPFCVTEHASLYGRGLVPAKHLRLAATVYHGAAAVAAVSGTLVSDLRRTVSRDVAYRVIPNVVDTEFFTARRPARSDRPFTFITVSDLVSVKRVDLLLDAFDAAFADDPSVRLVVGGDGPLRATLESQARKQRTSGQVCFLGRLVGRDAVRNALWQADAFALASSYETFGVVLVEALACGIPVVATDCGGPAEIVTPGVGLLCAPGDRDAVRNALARLRATHDQYKPGALHSYAHSVYGRDAIVRLTLAMYREALQSARP